MTGLLVRWRNAWDDAEEELEVASADRGSAAVETRRLAAAAVATEDAIDTEETLDTDKTLDLAALVADHAPIGLPVVALTFAAVAFGSVALAFLWLALAP